LLVTALHAEHQTDALGWAHEVYGEELPFGCRSSAWGDGETSARLALVHLGERDPLVSAGKLPCQGALEAGSGQESFGAGIDGVVAVAARMLSSWE
jgi:hypothetical protein